MPAKTQRQNNASLQQTANKFTIVTVTFNNSAELEKTILSVLEQTYPNVDYIIVDGGSLDGSVDTILEHKENLKFWVSEPDNGIYDAMNKGLKQADSDSFICFMNAGDTFSSKTTIAEVNSQLEPETDVIFGAVTVKYPDLYTRTLSAKNIDQLWKGMCFSHQAVFIKTKLAQETGYDIEYTIAADFKHMCELRCKTSHFKKINQTIATITSGGVSDTKRLESVRSHWSIARQYWPSLKLNGFYIVKLFDMWLRQSARWILPRNIISGLIRLKVNAQN